MTPRFSAGQNRMKLIAVFVFTVLLVLTFQWFRPSSQLVDGQTGTVSERPAPDVAGFPLGSVSAQPVAGQPLLNPQLFMGVRRASPGEIHQALPDARGKLAMVEFYTRLCHDCQKLAPVLERVSAAYPQVYFRKVDVSEDKTRAAGILRVFKPVSVPVVVFIDAQGHIQNVLYGFQEESVLRNALQALTPADTAKRPATP